MKLYFEGKNEEHCYGVWVFKTDMEIYGLEEMELYEAKRQDADGFFWCNYYSNIGERNNGECGKHCEGYTPRNGKSGCCTHYSLKLYEPGKKVVLLRNGNKFKLKTNRT